MPPNVRQAIREAWLAQPEPRELPINCNGYAGTFFVSATKECFIRNAAGQVIRPTQFERDCGIAQRKDWQRSIRVPGGFAVCLITQPLCFGQKQPGMVPVPSPSGC